MKNFMTAWKMKTLSIKIVRNVPANRNSDEVKAKRFTYAQDMYEEGVHVDEDGYNR